MATTSKPKANPKLLQELKESRKKRGSRYDPEAIREAAKDAESVDELADKLGVPTTPPSRRIAFKAVVSRMASKGEL